MIKTINAENFQPYGRVIEYPKKHLKGNEAQSPSTFSKAKSAEAKRESNLAKAETRNLFRIVLTESKRTGWRIAYLIVRDKTIKRLESHPHSFESFEPIRGKSLLFVAKAQDTASIECFSLDLPIILKKGIWHGVVTTTDECEIKLTENAKVNCVYWPLGFNLPVYRG